MNENRPDALEIEHSRLVAEQRELLREHEYFENHPADLSGHREHSRKLRAHIEALHNHLNALRDVRKT